MSARVGLADVLGKRVVVIDGAMGTMLQGFDLTLTDFADLEGCNEILNVTRPDVVADVHRAYFEAGADAVETNTFGANLAALGEYDIAHRIGELAEAGARIARQVADEAATAERPRWVIGSVGPGTKLPTLGQIAYADIRDGYTEQVEGLLAGGVDAVQVETCQDLLQAKAAILGARRAMRGAGREVPLICLVTVETNGSMLLGSEIGAALTSLAPLGIDLIGLNCATGPAEMSEHLRHLSRFAPCGVAVMPNAGLPELTKDGARYPLDPSAFVGLLEPFVDEFGLSLVGGCCGTTPEHIAALAAAVADRPVSRAPRPAVPAVASLYSDVTLKQDTSYLSIGERTNANGSKAFREAMLARRWDDCVDVARKQTAEGSHVLDVCVDYTGRDGGADMAEFTGRLATASTTPLMLDSTEPEHVRAGLERLGGRAIVNSVNFEDGDAPGSRFRRMMELVAEHGTAVVALTIDETGMARTADDKLRVAERLLATLTGEYGLAEGDVLVDCLTFPIGTGQEETRRDGIETLEAIRELKRRHPDVGTTLGVSNVSFGLKPAARVVLNSVFLHEAIEAGLDSAIVHAAKIVPLARIPEEQREVALDLIYDRRRDDYDPLARYLELFADATTAAASAADRYEGMTVLERLQRRIIDGDAKGLEPDLDEALGLKQALEIINDDLLAGMKVVGELFGSGQMQLPFVLQSAEVMKKAVAHLEPTVAEQSGDAQAGRGTIVLATVKGDVHDIGKNLVDIILSNNGYHVINLGIKQPVNAIIEAAEAAHADAIGMSGLLVKSTMIMKDNLAELNQRGLSGRYPVLLGGAALTRAYVERDLSELFTGKVFYARDAFDGLELMDSIMAVKRGEPGAELPQPKPRRVPAGPSVVVEETEADDSRSDVERLEVVPKPPFWGSRTVKGIALADVARWLDERALFYGQWGLKPIRGAAGEDGPSYDELVETQGRPRLRMWLDRIQTEGLAEFAVAYGYYRCYSAGRELIVLDDGGAEAARFSFPRQRRGDRLCLADYFRDEAEAERLGPDVVALQVATMGSRVSEKTAELFAANSYRDYLELHGLSVQLTEALAEFWHAREREQLGIGARPDAVDGGEIEHFVRKADYRGCRYSFGYPACPDLEQRRPLVDLVGADRIGVVLSEGFQLHPEQSTDAIVVHHPEAHYFNAT